MNAERACDNCRKLTSMSELRSLCSDCKCWTLEELQKAQDDWNDAKSTSLFLDWLVKE